MEQYPSAKPGSYELDIDCKIITLTNINGKWVDQDAPEMMMFLVGDFYKGKVARI